MFMGQDIHNLDAKGRVFIPVKHREELSDSFIIAPGVDSCLSVYPHSEWEKIVSAIDVMPDSERLRRMKRFLFGNAIKCEIDKQGRVLIPDNLRKYAKLTREIVFIGAQNKIEIWSKQDFKEDSGYDEPITIVAEELGHMGLKL